MKIFKEIVELFCFYLRDQDKDSGTAELKFTLFLERFLPHNSRCHQAIKDELGPPLRALGKELIIPSDPEETKESIFRELWNIYIKTMESFLEAFDEEEERFATNVNIAIADLIKTASIRTAARRYLERYIKENQMKVGPE